MPGSTTPGPMEPLLVPEGIREVVAAVVGDEPGALGDELRLYDDLGFDSVMLMELKYRLEVRFPELGELALPEMLSGLVSVGALAEYVRGLLAQAAV